MLSSSPSPPASMVGPSSGPFLFVLVVLVLDNIVCSTFVEGFTKYLPCVDVIASSMLNNCFLGEADSPNQYVEPVIQLVRDSSDLA